MIGDLTQILEIPRSPDGRLDVATLNTILRQMQERVFALEGRTQPSEIRDRLSVLGGLAVQGAVSAPSLALGSAGTIAPSNDGIDGELRDPLVPYVLVRTDPLGALAPMEPSVFRPAAVDSFLSAATTSPVGILGWTVGGGTVTLGSPEAAHDGVIVLTSDAGPKVSALALNTALVQNVSYAGFVIKTGDDAAIINVGLRAGLVSDPLAAGGEAQEGVYFSFLDGTSANWRTITRDGSGVTANETDIPVAASSWYLLEIIISPEAETVDFYINRTRAFRHSTNLTTSAVSPAFVVEATDVDPKDASIDTFAYLPARPVARLWT